MRYVRLFLISAVICVSFSVFASATSTNYKLYYSSPYEKFEPYAGPYPDAVTAAMLPDVKTPDGMEFKGWYLSDETLVSVGDKALPNGSTLYAVYSEVTVPEPSPSPSPTPSPVPDPEPIISSDMSLADVLDSISELLSASMSWVASVASSVSTTPIFLIAVILGFIPVGITLFRRLL